MGWLDKIASRIASELDEPLLSVDDQAQLELAQAYLERGDLDEARTRVNDLLARYARVPEVLQLSGMVAHASGHGDEAVTLLGRAVDAEPTRASSWLSLAQVLLPLQRYEPAADAARKALRHADKIIDGQARQRVQAEAHAVRGRVALAQHRFETARRELDRAMALGLSADPGIAADHGRALVRLDPVEGARWLLHAARGPAASTALVLEAAGAQWDPQVAAELLTAFRKTQSALADAEALRIDARTARALANLGEAEKAAALLPAGALDDGEAAVDCAYAAAALGRYADACRFLNAAADDAVDPATRLAWALGTQQEKIVREVAAKLRTAAPELAAHVDNALAAPADPNALLEILVLAPNDASRNHWAALCTPAPPEDATALAFIQALERIAAPLAPPPAFMAALMRTREALTRPLLVALLGEFNAGKSSLVNALVETPLAPVGIKPTTATLNVFRHGMGGAHVIYGSGKVRRLETAQVQPFLSTLAQEDAEAIEAVDIFLPHAPLQSFEWVDTPGLNAPQAAHERTTKQFMRLADIAVWVLSAQQAGKATEVAVLEELRESHTPVLALLNKTDQLDPEEIPVVHAVVAQALGARVFGILDATVKGDPAAAAAALSQALSNFSRERIGLLKQRAALAALHVLTGQAQRLAAVAVPEDALVLQMESTLKDLREALLPQPAEAALVPALTQALHDAAAVLGESAGAGEAMTEAFVIRVCLRDVEAALAQAKEHMATLPHATRSRFDVAAQCYLAQMRGRLEAGVAARAMDAAASADVRRRVLEQALPEVDRFLWAPWRAAIQASVAQSETELLRQTRLLSSRVALHQARVVAPLQALAARLDDAWHAVVRDVDAAAAQGA